MENEIWVDVIGYEGLYEVSNLGRVKSLPRKWVLPNGGIKSHDGIIMKQIKQKAGYMCVPLRKDKKRQFCKVHRLVFESFNGKTDLFVDHIVERNQSDNRLENLQALNCRANISKNKLSLKRTSRFTGVCFIEKYKSWQSQIWVKPKKIWLGYFNTEIEAHNAYQNALNKYFPSLNPITS